jgi:hypothetical protein
MIANRPSARVPVSQFFVPEDGRPLEKIVVGASDPEAAPGSDKLKVFRPLDNVQLVRDLDSSPVLA